MTFHDERLSAYLDDDLSKAERAALEAELQQDGQLSNELEQLSAARDFMQKHGEVPAPDDLFDSIMAELPDDNVVSLAAWRRPFGIPLSGLAVAAIALMVVYVAMPNSVSPDSTPATAAQPKSADKTKRLNDKVSAVSSLDTKSQATKQKTDDAPQRQANKPQPLAVQVPYRYVLTTADPTALKRMAAVAVKYEGVVGDGRLEMAPLTTSDSAAVTVHLPHTAITAFEAQLRGLGDVQAIPDGSMFPGNPVDVHVDVRLVIPKKAPASKKGNPFKTIPQKKSVYESQKR